MTRREGETKRHRWVDDKCVHCDLRRAKVQARSQRGCFGWHHFERTIYRNGVGAEVWCSDGGVPPCRPPTKVFR